MSIRALALSTVTVAALAGSANAQVITRWNFNGGSTTTVPGGTTAPTPSTGTGTAALFGGTTASYASGTANGGSTDPVITTPANYGWNITTFSAQSANSGGSGVQFNVSTVGFSAIQVSWDQRHSNTSSRFVQFQYSTDGSTFTNFGSPFVGNAGDTWFNNRSVDLSSIAAVDNNANFAFRIVAVFDPSSTPGAYAASNSGVNYAGTGTWRFDMVTVSVVPTPGAAALMGLGALAATRRRRA